MLFWVLIDALFIVTPAVSLTTITARRKTAVLAASILVVGLVLQYEFAAAMSRCGSQAPVFAIIGAPALLLYYWPVTLAAVIALSCAVYWLISPISRSRVAMGLTVLFVAIGIAAASLAPTGLVSGDTRYPCALF